jgi:phosphoribosyl-ATP pyrophosphohydrolase/phosphoribosyl-AMP cyclohydrolase
MLADVSPKFDSRGLVPAVVQDRLSGEVRMVAWMSEASLQATQESGFATFYSRSRQALWQKGETSGNRLVVREIIEDCDGDTLLVLADPAGPSCHTGRPSCFFTPRPAVPILLELERVITERASSTADRSYTKLLLDGGAGKIGEKLREEADELARAIDAETDDRVAAEAADVIFHLLVGLELRGIPWRRVLEVLAERATTSGHAEKAARSGGGGGPRTEV